MSFDCLFFFTISMFIMILNLVIFMTLIKITISHQPTLFFPIGISLFIKFLFSFYWSWRYWSLFFLSLDVWSSFITFWWWGATTSCFSIPMRWIWLFSPTIWSVTVTFLLSQWSSFFISSMSTPTSFLLFCLGFIFLIFFFFNFIFTWIWKLSNTFQFLYRSWTTCFFRSFVIFFLISILLRLRDILKTFQSIYRLSRIPIFIEILMYFFRLCCFFLRWRLWFRLFNILFYKWFR